MKNLKLKLERHWKNILLIILSVLLLLAVYFLFFNKKEAVGQNNLQTTLFPRLTSFDKEEIDNFAFAREYLAKICGKIDNLSGEELDKYNTCVESLFTKEVANIHLVESGLASDTKIILDNLDPSLPAYKNHEAIYTNLVKINNQFMDLTILTCQIDANRYIEPLKDNDEQLICMLSRMLDLEKDLNNLGKVFVYGTLSADVIPAEKQNEDYKKLLEDFKGDLY